LTPLPGAWLGGPRIYLGGEQLGLVGADISSGFKFLAGGNPGEVYAVEGSTNLNTWTDAGRITNAYGVVDFLDGTTSGQDQRFYRLRVVTP
jgi:hypothetical protein